MKKVLLFFALLIFLGCSNQPESDKSHLDYKAMAEKVIAQAKLQSGEKVLLVIDPGRFDPMVGHLKKAIEDRGAIYLGTESLGKSDNEDWNTDYVDALQQMAGEELTNYLEVVNLGIMMPGATPVDIVYDGLQKVLQKGKSRTIHFHWQGAYDLNGKLLEVDTVIDRFYQKVLLETNYEQLGTRQVAFENAMRGNWVQVTTPAGTDIKFQIGDRQVTKQDGDASLNHMTSAKTLIDREVELPAGAIRVAPIEASVEGTIAFPDARWNNEEAAGVTIKIKGGKIESVNADQNLEAVKSELMGGGEAAQWFREFALGFNPLLAIPESNPWIPYYGYGAGVVRLSLGDNSELGGNVTGGYVRWNFFPDATVKVGDEVWVENGKLIK